MAERFNIDTITQADIERMSVSELNAFLDQYDHNPRQRAMQDLANLSDSDIDLMNDSEVDAVLDLANGLGLLTEADSAKTAEHYTFDLTYPEQARAFTDLLADENTFDLHNPEERQRFQRHCRETGTTPKDHPTFDVSGLDLSNVDKTSAMTEDELLARWSQEV